MRSKSRWLSTGALALLLSVMLFGIPVFAQDGPDDCSSLAVARVSQTVNDGDRTLLQQRVHPLARAEFDLGRVDDNQPMEHIILVLKRSPAQELALITHIDELQSPRGRWCSLRTARPSRAARR